MPVNVRLGAKENDNEVFFVFVYLFRRSLVFTSLTNGQFSFPISIVIF